MKKVLPFTVLVTGLTLLLPGIAMAHVIVTPNRAGVGQELTFNVSVPNERQTPVTNLKLLIPSGVTDVTPTVANGWTITPTLSIFGGDTETTAITWSNSTIPVGQREDFSFSAQVPGKTASLDWKAYQTYGDGTIVHWDQKPAGSDDAAGNAGPYSVTNVVNDLNTPAPAAAKPSNTPLILSLVAIVLSIFALMRRPVPTAGNETGAIQQVPATPSKKDNTHPVHKK